MTLGDSITGSPGCWRALLWSRLQSAGFQNTDFVGTLPPQGCGIPYDGENEGHGGFLATNVANQNQLVGWLAATRPDIVVMHFGTNDVWNNIPPATILAAFTRLVDQMRASNPNMKILVAQIIPMAPTNCADCAQRVVTLNSQIPAWASSRSTTQSPVIVVDQWTGFNTATDTNDGVHPNAAGDQKIANRWFPALSALLTPGQPPPPPPPPPPGDNRGCSAAYRVINQWPGGFQGEVTVTNTGTAPINGWTVTFAFANAQSITQSWNATVTQNQSTVTAVSPGGRPLPAASSTNFGFLGNWSATNASPTPSCVAN